MASAAEEHHPPAEISQPMADEDKALAAPSAALSPPVRSPKSPLKPLGAQVSPYLMPPNSKGSPKGKGSHISTMKSLGLLHDLQVSFASNMRGGCPTQSRQQLHVSFMQRETQEYITNVEALTMEQKQELQRLKEEKRDVERVRLRGPVDAVHAFRSVWNKHM
jgi:hypothetical protein